MTTLAAPSRPPMSPARIAGYSGAIALHLALLLVLMTPQAVPRPPAEVVESMEIEWIVAEKQTPPQPVPEVPPPPVRPAPPREQAPEVVIERVVESAFQVPVSSPEPVREPIGPIVPDPGPPPATVAALAYADVPPPPYPAMARKKNWQGEVLLRVRVDESGRPVAVEIEKSSGHRVLDRAARDHVLKRWRFQPALVEGRPVAAWARVPLNFRIEAG